MFNGILVLHAAGAGVSDSVHGWYPSDGGPIYRETFLGHPDDFLAEPWNAITSLFIVLPGLYWLWRLRGQYRAYMVLTFCIPLLIAGGIGSTLYHAFRSTPGFLYLDFVPPLLLTLTLSVYLWKRVLGSWWMTIAVILGSFAVRALAYVLFQEQKQLVINISYGLNGLTFLLPLLIVLIRSRFRDAGWIIGAMVFLALALAFRQLDDVRPPIFHIGTHFLWHILTGFGGFALAEYLYRIETYRKSGHSVGGRLPAA